MTTIYFATSNKGKVMAFQNRLPAGFKAEQLIVEIPEVQNKDVEEIVKSKAKIAFEKTGKSLIVQDSAFHIKALAGFPGPYIKYINETIGAKGIIKLMKGIRDREAYFQAALAFVDEKGKIKTFVSDIAIPGKISNKVAIVDSEKAWSEIWKVYIPSWANGKTLTELSKEEINKHEQEADKSSEFAKFVVWLNSQK
jgi:non-canonical purine NTP pyrophosphatase (RdgB/HAM1 family)